MAKQPMTEERFETKLANLLTRRLDPVGGHVTTFHDAGVLTMNRGLVVSLPNGQQFHLTIVESTPRY
ncbi:hypothetical protein [Thermopirellula anaerolimosa]|jgi:hypothetical protein